MAKVESRAPKGNAVTRYFKETRAELRKVHWPSQQETRMLTLVVVSVTVSMAALLGLLDFVFDRLLKGIIDVNPLAIGLSVLMLIGLFAAGIVIAREE
jgi:preprotein translocase subunit SecE